MGKAPLDGGRTGPNPTDRGKGGVRRSVLADGRGVPGGGGGAGADVNDLNRFRGVLIRWPKKPQNDRAFVHVACAIALPNTPYRIGS